MPGRHQFDVQRPAGTHLASSIASRPPSKGYPLPTSADLPEYEPMLAAYHRAFAVELREIVASLPIREGDRVVEMACGDGAYSPWLASRVGPTGFVLAIDVSATYLQVAHGLSSRMDVASRVAHVASPVERLPLTRDTFDLAWCAQSLYSLPDQLAAVRIMADLVRPGGTVAVLENDTLHQLVLPWPVEVELAVRKAELEALAERGDSPSKYYVGRRLSGLFDDAGLVEVHARAWAATRQAPLDAPTREFLVAYLAGLRGRVADRLDVATRRTFLELADPESDTGLVNQPDLTLTVLDHVVTGVKPSPCASGSTTPAT
jgi:SAM-dependent methyltransferase